MWVTRMSTFLCMYRLSLLNSRVNFAKSDAFRIGMRNILVLLKHTFRTAVVAATTAFGVPQLGVGTKSGQHLELHQ